MHNSDLGAVKLRDGRPPMRATQCGPTCLPCRVIVWQQVSRLRRGSRRAMGSHVRFPHRPPKWPTRGPGRPLLQQKWPRPGQPCVLAPSPPPRTSLPLRHHDLPLPDKQEPMSPPLCAVAAEVILFGRWRGVDSAAASTAVALSPSCAAGALPAAAVGTGAWGTDTPPIPSFPSSRPAAFLAVVFRSVVARLAAEAHRGARDPGGPAAAPATPAAPPRRASARRSTRTWRRRWEGWRRCRTQAAGGGGVSPCGCSFFQAGRDRGRGGLLGVAAVAAVGVGAGVGGGGEGGAGARRLDRRQRRRRAGKGSRGRVCRDGEDLSAALGERRATAGGGSGVWAARRGGGGRRSRRRGGLSRRSGRWR